MMSENLRVLVFDQDSSFLKIADQKLSERGFQVFPTTSLIESCNLLKALDFHYVMAFNKEDKKLLLELISTFKKRPIVVDENFEESGLH